MLRRVSVLGWREAGRVRAMSGFGLAAETPARASMCCGAPHDDTAPTHALYEALKEICQNNASYFNPDESENGQRLYQGFMGLMDHVDTVWPLVDHVRKVAPAYDFDSKSVGNGYRSFVSVVDSCALHGLKLSRQVCASRDALLFRKGYFVREVESCGQLLASLGTCLHHLHTLLTWAPAGDLFPSELHSPEELFAQADTINQEVESCGQLLASLGTCLHHLHTLLTWAPAGDLFPSELHSPEELFAQADTINQYCFYGRCLGFQFLPSMRGILKGISICMAGFSEAYYSHGNLISSVWTGGQYLIDPELRARRIVNISQCASVDFCKAFWFLAESEIMQRVPSLVSSTVSVNKLISVPPEPLTALRTDGSELTVQPPAVHVGLHALNLRLISYNKRQGMPSKFTTVNLSCGKGGDAKPMPMGSSVGEGSGGLPPSDGILFHCHGGGFVAQSSKSHEVYLREWAASLNMPILSVDYSLAPHAPFPRALEEVFYAYCWMLNHFNILGTTGKRIVLAGDSAGANLIAGCTLKILDAGVRVPDGLFMAYAPLLVSFIPSPARLLCLMDPLLPFGFMMRCLKAYACPPNIKSKDGKNHNKDQGSESASNATTPVDSNGFLKISPSQEGISEGPSSFEEVSTSELQAHKSGSERRRSSDTTVSAASLQSEHTHTGVTPPEDVSQQYVSDFLERYVLDSDTDSEGRKIPVIKPNPSCVILQGTPHREGDSENSSTLIGERPSAPDEKKDKKKIQTRLSKAASGLMGAVSSKFSYITASNHITHCPQDMAVRSNMDALIARSPSDEFIFSVPRDPYLSPYWADDELLKRFPPVRILSVHLDPCLDDCVMFAKKLKRLGNSVGVDVLEGLPHGFLNFSLMCKEANEGSKLCVERIREMMNCDATPAQPSQPPPAPAPPPVAEL